MKWVALFALVVLQVSCTTLANRRDLYSPEPGCSYATVVKSTTTTTVRTEMRANPSEREDINPPPYR